MQYRAVIIEDEDAAIAELQDMLQSSIADNSLVIVGEANTVDSSYALVMKEQPDIIFSDIDFKEGIKNGLTLIKDLLKEVNDKRLSPFEVIFVTGYRQHLINALRLSAADYLIKSEYIEEDIKNAFNKACQKIVTRRELAEYIKNLEEILNNIRFRGGLGSSICIPNKDKGIDFVKISAIVYFETGKNIPHSCIKGYFSDREPYYFAFSLNKIEEQLGKCSEYFIRFESETSVNIETQNGVKTIPSKSTYLVNIENILTITYPNQQCYIGFKYMENGKMDNRKIALPKDKTKKEKLLEQINNKKRPPTVFS